MRSSLSSQESSANHSILMYHSTPSTPNTAGKAPAPSPHTAVQTEGTLSFHKVEDENAWGIAADPTVPLKVESVLKVQLKRVGRDHGIFKAEVKKMRFNLVPNLFNTDQMKIVNTRWAGEPPNGPGHLIGPIPTEEIARSLAESLIRGLPNALPNMTADDMTIHPDLVGMDKPKMTVVVSDKKRDCSGELFPHSIFVVLNDEVNVLQVKVKKVFPALSDTLFGEEPDAMYPALGMLYTENKMENIVGFYKNHGFDVYISEELRTPKRKAVDQLN